MVGERDKAQQALAQLQELSGKQQVLRGHFALIYAGMGEQDRAFELFEEAYEQHEGMLLLLNHFALLKRSGRRRVRGAATVPEAVLTRQQEVVDAFLAAARGGGFDALLAVLDPDVVLRADSFAMPSVQSTEVRGAEAVAKRAIRGGARAARPALVNGAVGVVVAPRGRLLMVLRFRIIHGKIVEIDVVADPARLRQLDITVLND